jgi:class 3 adenylate cyclase
MDVDQATPIDLVVLFTDIHEYSSVVKALGMDGPRPAQFIQEVYRKTGDAVVQQGGEILQYHGDGILCTFPGGCEGRAVQCALDMREAYAMVVNRWRIAHDTELEVGISAGKVRVGMVGHPSVRQKGLFGTDVFAAAVIGHHRGIAVTRGVYEAIKDAYPTRRLPDRQVGWQDAPLEVWEIAAGGDR